MNTVDRPRPADIAAECLSDVKSAMGDRRRPNRLNDVSPNLVCLLRESDVQGTVQPESAEDAHDGTPMLGVLFALGLSIPLWGAVILAVQAVLR